MGNSNSVRSDVGVKSSQIVSKVALKVATVVFIESEVFHLGNFCYKFCHQELSKIAQSGHTEFDATFSFSSF